jgi:hypothetical protein
MADVDMRPEAFGQVNSGGKTGEQVNSNVSKMQSDSGNLSGYSAKVCQVPGCGKFLTYNISTGDKAGRCPVHSETEMDVRYAKPTTLAPTDPRLKLTPAEKTVTYEKDGKKVTVQMVDPSEALVAPVAAPVKQKRVKKAVDEPNPEYMPPARKKANSVPLDFTLDELSSENLPLIILNKLLQEIGNVKCNNFNDYERIAKIKANIQKLTGEIK